MKLEIFEREEEGFSVVKAVGEVDVFTAPKLKSKVEEVLSSHHSIALDLSETNYMDSTGLSVLISALKRSRTQAGECVLLSPHQNVKKLLKLTGMDEVFCMKESLGEEEHE